MTHYTILPMEAVMKGIDQMEDAAVEITVNGISMQVQPLSATQASIVRILSGNPQHYLNPQFTPGRIIEFQPVL